MYCGGIEENLGVLDQCYSNYYNNFVTTAVLGVINYVLLETRLRGLIELLLMLEVSEPWTLNA